MGLGKITARRGRWRGEFRGGRQRWVLTSGCAKEKKRKRRELVVVGGGWIYGLCREWSSSMVLASCKVDDEVRCSSVVGEDYGQCSQGRVSACAPEP